MIIIPYRKITVNALEDIFPSEYTDWGGVSPLDGRRPHAGFWIGLAAR